MKKTDVILSILAVMIVAVLFGAIGALVVQEHRRMERLGESEYYIVLPNSLLYYASSYEVTSNGISFRENERGRQVEYYGDNF